MYRARSSLVGNLSRKICLVMMLSQMVVLFGQNLALKETKLRRAVIHRKVISGKPFYIHVNCSGYTDLSLVHWHRPSAWIRISRDKKGIYGNALQAENSPVSFCIGNATSVCQCFSIQIIQPLSRERRSVIASRDCAIGQQITKIVILINRDFATMKASQVSDLKSRMSGYARLLQSQIGVRKQSGTILFPSHFGSLVNATVVPLAHGSGHLDSSGQYTLVEYTLNCSHVEKTDAMILQLISAVKNGTLDLVLAVPVCLLFSVKGILGYAVIDRLTSFFSIFLLLQVLSFFQVHSMFLCIDCRSRYSFIRTFFL